MEVFYWANPRLFFFAYFCTFRFGWSKGTRPSAESSKNLPKFSNILRNFLSIDVSDTREGRPSKKNKKILHMNDKIRSQKESVYRVFFRDFFLCMYEGIFMYFGPWSYLFHPLSLEDAFFSRFLENPEKSSLYFLPKNHSSMI